MHDRVLMCCEHISMWITGVHAQQLLTDTQLASRMHPGAPAALMPIVMLCRLRASTCADQWHTEMCSFALLPMTLTPGLSFFIACAPCQVRQSRGDESAGLGDLSNCGSFGSTPAACRFAAWLAYCIT